MIELITIDDPDLLAIEEWLEEHSIRPRSFLVIDETNIGVYHDVVLEITFNDPRDAVLFKLAWIGR